MTKTKVIVISLLFLSICLAIAGVTIYFITRKKKLKTADETHSQIITLENDTIVDYQVSAGGSVVIVGPKSVSKISAQYGMPMDFQYMNPDGSIVRHNGLIFSRDHNLIYLTYNGPFTKQQANVGEIVNQASFPVIFVQYSTTGNRWPVEIVGPDSSRSAIITPGTKYEVVHPAQENDPISVIYADRNTNKVIFNDTSMEKMDR